MVLKRTGLSAELLRAWERRYGVVAPSRTKGGQRLYTEADVARLSLLRRATLHGHSIGRLSELPDLDIAALVHEPISLGPASAEATSEAAAAAASVKRCLQAVHWMDGATLDLTLRRAAMLLGPVAFAETVVTPLVREVGELWHQGRLRIVQEHFTTATVRQVMSGILASLPCEPSAPVFVSGTTSGQHHELGAMLAAAAAAAAGWRSLYLGPDLPGDEIAIAATQLHARAIGLSIVFPIDGVAAEHEFAALAAALGSRIPVLVGGEGAGHLKTVIERVGFTRVESLTSLQGYLTIRAPSA